MKSCTLLSLFLVLFCFSLPAQRPQYHLKFQYRTTGGAERDTMITRLAYKFWSKSDNYPSYVKWKNTSFAISPSVLNGVGLFTDSSTSYTIGDTIGFAYFKIANIGKFDRDYYESNIGTFINDSDNPNMLAVITPQGIILKALRAITPNTELTASYHALLDLFPNDHTAVNALKYW